MAGLTHKQQRFVEEYAVDLNATQAAIRAGYSPKGATVRGSELLANRKIKAALAKVRQEQQERASVTADLVLEGLFREAQNASSDAARVSAWAWLGKHFALFTDRVEHSGEIRSGVMRVPDGFDGAPDEWEQVAKQLQARGSAVPSTNGRG